MATFQELASGYAKRIREAIALDGFTNRTRVASHEIKNSKTLQTAKEIGREIDGLVYTASRQPLSDADKRAIKELIDRELGLPTRMQKSFAVESASNDDLSDLSDFIENIIGGNK